MRVCYQMMHYMTGSWVLTASPEYFKRRGYNIICKWKIIYKA